VKKKHSVTLQIGICMMGILVLLALLAPIICKYDPLEQNLYDYLQGPGPEHLLGTDQLGRDFLTRLIYAARTDLFVMVTAEIIPFATGIFLGMVAGYFGGAIDWIITLVTDTFIAFPFYLLVIVVAFVTGAGVHGIYITFILVGWITYAKVIRGMTSSMRKQEWVQAAKVMGYSDLKILIKQILPNVLPQAIILLMSDMVGLLVVIVTLGYLGIGISAPTPDWGTMISEGQTFISTQWRLSVLPGLMVVYTGISLSLIGDGLADRWRQDGF
jgi:peptide/nickel transport system permease protein